MGMFTPPSFNLESSSQETIVSESSIDGGLTDEDGIPNFVQHGAPLA
jgi:hypothetical protein